MAVIRQAQRGQLKPGRGPVGSLGERGCFPGQAASRTGRGGGAEFLDGRQVHLWRHKDGPLKKKKKNRRRGHRLHWAVGEAAELEERCSRKRIEKSHHSQGTALCRAAEQGSVHSPFAF